MTNDDAASCPASRPHFPVLDEATYLNTASVGIVPSPVRANMQALAHNIASRGTLGFDDETETHVYDSARTNIARLIGAHADDVAIVQSTAEAIAQVAWWLRPPRGSNVVSLNIEFPSVTYPWLRVAEATGATVRIVEAPTDPDRSVFSALAAAIDERTAVVSVSHVQYATGRRFDLAELAALADAHQALLVVDATHSAGVLPLDVAAAEPAVLVASGSNGCAAHSAPEFAISGRISERV